MKKCKRTLFNRIKKLAVDNGGSAIVLVIIAMAMIGILAATIGWSSYINFKIKMADQRTKISFYEAETAMEQILAGLQNEASVSVNDSYQEVMKNWVFDEESGQMDHKERFGKKYLEDMWKKFEKGSVTFNYRSTTELVGYCDLNTLTKYVEDSTISKSVWVDSEDNPITEIKMIYSPSKGAIVFKNLGIQYTDNDYVAKITTDIAIDVPNLAFTQEVSLSDILDGNYCLIGNEGIDVIGEGALKLKCNAYAGEKGIMIGAGIRKTETDEFLSSSVGNLVVEDGCSELLSKGDIELVKLNSKMTVSSKIDSDPKSVYANSIILNGGEVVVDEYGKDVSLYVQDDLELRGSGSKVNLKTGNYYGYGNGNSGDPSGIASAIVINGTNSSINLGVKKLLLAGTAYVGNHRAANGTEYDFDPCRMGESIAVKGGQVAYMAPNETIFLGTDTATPVRISQIGMNPVNYSALAAGTKAYCDMDEPVYKLGGRSLKSLKVNKVCEFFDPTSNLEYFYLVFGSDKDAKEFFKIYYGYEDDFGFSKDSKTAIDTYISMRYAQGGIILAGADVANDGISEYEYTISGNVFTYDPTAVDALHPTGEVKLREYDKKPDADDLENIVDTRDEKFKTADIFNYLVDNDAFNSIATDLVFESSSGFKAVVSPGDYTVNDSSIRFVLAKGDITIKNDYKGCAFAGKNVKLEAGGGGHTIEPDTIGIYEAVNTVLEVGGLKYTPLSFFKGNPVSLDENGMLEVDYSEMVRYVNWIKQ